MKLKHRPLLSPSIAQLAWHVARTTGAARAPHRDDCVERFVSPRHEVIAAPLPKVASRTMMGMFEAMPYKTEVLDASPAELRQRYPGFFIFSVVRNPWARVLSFWKDKV